GKNEIGCEEFFPKTRVIEDTLRLRIELAHDVLWRAFGRDQSVPRSGLVTGQPAFGERGHVGVLRDTRGAAEAEYFERARLPGLCNKSDADDHHLDVTADEVGDRRCCAAVVHGCESGAG